MMTETVTESRKVGNVLIPPYKGKGDAKECSNYKSLKMLEHNLKILEIVFERRI